MVVENRKSPKETAETVGIVEKCSYLAHSIRKIEREILRKWGKHYHVITYSSTTQNKKSKILFRDQCCEIRLPSECEDIDDRRIRLTLAHELGHLIYNIDKLKIPEILENEKASDEEEQYAWEFAFYLIRMKSDEHKNNITRKKFIYDDDDLKHSLSSVLKTKKPEVYKAVAKSLKLPQ